MSPEDQIPDATVVRDDVGDRLAHIGNILRASDLARRHGRVSDLIGLVVEATGLQAEVGEICMVNGDRGHPPVPAEVVGFRGQRTLLMPLGEMHGIGPATTARATGTPFRIRVGDDLLGRVIDGLGSPIDGLPARDRRHAALRRRLPARPARAPAHRHARRPRRARARRARAVRPRPAARHLRRLRRRQVLAAGHDRPLDDGRRQRDRARRRARSRGARVHRARPRRRDQSARSSSSRRPTSPRSCASRRPSRRPRSPSTSATRART